MSAVEERIPLRDLREANVVARPEDAPVGLPMGLVWLKGRQQDVTSLGLKKALRTARIHEGREQPTDELPAAVVICGSNVEDVAQEVKSARALAPHSVVLVFVPSPDLRLARGALEAGARGLLHAGMHPQQILRAIRVALQGETVLPRCLLSEWADEHRPPELGLILSARQREILELVVEGLSNAEIAGRLFLSESTIKQHLGAAYKALGVRNRIGAATLLRRCRKGHGRKAAAKAAANSEAAASGGVDG
jgi:DNA-binding NarL/FixJ family response regulator